MTVFRSFILGGCAITLAACSTVSGEPIDSSKPALSVASGLTPQTLEPGECGLFGWETTANPDFIFFATNNRGLYLRSQGDPVALNPEGSFPEMAYQALSLDLGEREALQGGFRYPAAKLTEVLDDGFTRIRPLVLLESCQPVSAPTALVE